METRKLFTSAGIVLTVLILTVAVQAAPTPYSGILKYVEGDEVGIVATPTWDNVATTFKWEVTNQGSHWNYWYKFDVGAGQDISHIIIEATGEYAAIGAFGSADMFNLWTSWNIEGGLPTISNHTGLQNPNPGMPTNLYGIKFDLEELLDDNGDNLGTTTTFEFSFDSRRNPMLGNFYAKDGGPTAAWNSGFELDREGISLHDAAAHGLIVVPNATVIPAPGAIVLVGIGTTMVGWLRRRRTF